MAVKNKILNNFRKTFDFLGPFSCIMTPERVCVEHCFYSINIVLYVTVFKIC